MLIFVQITDRHIDAIMLCPTPVEVAYTDFTFCYVQSYNSQFATFIHLVVFVFIMFENIFYFFEFWC